MALDHAIQNISTQISPSLSSVVNEVKQAAVWLGRQVVVITKEILNLVSKAGSALSHFARQVVSFASPYFASLKDYLIANKEVAIAATAGIAAGAASYAIASHVFCKEKAKENI